MDQIPHRDQPLETTAKTTANAGPKPWYSQYKYEEQKGDHRLPHGDPRTEALQSYDRHQEPFDSDLSSPDDNHGYGYPGFGSGFTPELDASASSASDQGTLAGGGDNLNDKEIDAKYYSQHSPDNSPNGQGSSRAVTRKNHRLLYPPRKSRTTVSQWHNLLRPRG